MKISLWNSLLVEWIYVNKNKIFAFMDTKWDCSNAAISMNLADNNKCHMALLRLSHSILWSASNKEIDIGIL